MKERLGAKRYAAPLAAIIIVACVFSLAFYPMTHLEPKGLPFGVLSLDEGLTTPAGTVNAGETMVENMTSLGGDGSTVSWERFDSQNELDEALETGALYGAVIVPTDFTASSAAAQAGSGEASALKIVIDNAKSPVVASLMQTNLPALFEQLGVRSEVEVVNQGAGAEGANALGAMMSQQIAVMPTVMLSVVIAAMIALVVTPFAGKRGRERWQVAGLQATLAVVFSLAVAVAIWLMVVGVAGIETDAEAILFLWIASFGLMFVLVGAFDAHVGLGALVAGCVFSFGMACGVMPLEMLPAFWQDWVFPWAPQRFIGEGMRAILYRGAGAWNASCPPLLAFAAAGAALVCIAAVLPGKTRREAPSETAPAVDEDEHR